MEKHLLVGCSFTDPSWQDAIPWSVHYSKNHQTSYIVAKAGMGWNGICTEAYMYAQNLKFDHCVIMLPTLWRMDIELNHEGNTCHAMVDLLESDGIIIPAVRKWIISGGLNFKQSISLHSKELKLFDQLYKYQDFLPIMREHVLKLKLLLLSLRARNISYTITAIKDPIHQLEGLDYIKDDIVELLDSVEYKNWLRFDGKFIDEFVGHDKHPTTEEHTFIGDYIWQNHLT
jgi:hypothetical protein